jgi:hypothetical protein
MSEAEDSHIGAVPKMQKPDHRLVAWVKVKVKTLSSLLLLVVLYPDWTLTKRGLVLIDTAASESEWLTKYVE